MGRPASAQRSEAGFSLVEILVALTITVVGLMGLMSLHASMIRGNREAARLAEATNFAQETLEKLRAIPVVDNDLSVPGPAETLETRFNPLPIDNVLVGTEVGQAGVTYAMRLSVTPISGTLVRMRVRVTWVDSGDDPSSATDPPENRHEVAVEIIRSTLEAL